MFKNKNIINHLDSSSSLNIARAVFMAGIESGSNLEIPSDNVTIESKDTFKDVLVLLNITDQKEQKAFLAAMVEVAQANNLIAASAKEVSSKPFYKGSAALDLRLREGKSIPLDAIKEALKKVYGEQLQELQSEVEEEITPPAPAPSQAEIEAREEAAAAREERDDAEYRADIAEAAAKGLPFVTKERFLARYSGDGTLKLPEGYIWVDENGNNNYAVLKIVSGHEDDSSEERYDRAVAAHQGRPYMSLSEAQEKGLIEGKKLKPGYEFVPERIGSTNFAVRPMEVVTHVRSANLENVVEARLSQAGQSTEKEKEKVKDAEANRLRVKDLENVTVNTARTAFYSAYEDVTRIEGEIRTIKEDRKRIEREYREAQKAFEGAEKAFNAASGNLAAGQIAERISEKLRPFAKDSITIEGLEVRGGKLYLKTKETLKVPVAKLNASDPTLFTETNRFEIGNVDANTKKAIEDNEDQILAYVANPDKDLQSKYDAAKTTKDTANTTLEEKKKAYDRMNEEINSKTDPLEKKKVELKTAKEEMAKKKMVLDTAKSNMERALKAEDKKIEAAQEALKEKALDEVLKLIADICKERGIKIDWHKGSTFVLDKDGLKFKPAQTITSDVTTQTEDGRNLIVGIENKKPVLILTSDMLSRESVKQLIADSGITNLNELERNRYERRLKQLIEK